MTDRITKDEAIRAIDELLAEVGQLAEERDEAKRLRSQALVAFRDREDTIEKAEKRASTAEMERDEALTTIEECTKLVSVWFGDGDELPDVVRRALTETRRSRDEWVRECLETREQRDEAIALAASRPDITREVARAYIHSENRDDYRDACIAVDGILRAHAKGTP
jgi:hypothetical protein